jgi:hypothetical protein
MSESPDNKLACERTGQRGGGPPRRPNSPVYFIAGAGSMNFFTTNALSARL